MDPVLSISNYALDYAVASGSTPALDDISLAIDTGEVLGLVGESGSGKSSLAFAIMRYLPRSARESGTIALSGQDLRAKAGTEIERIRGRRIGMVFQDPGTSLNPTLPIGEQIAEVMVKHRGLTRRQAWNESEAALDRVGLKTPAAMMRRYPHEVSGGEKQRVVIATAFACRPQCIIFDEPTTALDIITARQILDLFGELQAETKVASLYISHDLGLVQRVANRVAVMHRGRIVEQGDVEAVFRKPKADYTRRLLAAVPHPNHRLVGTAPNAAQAPLVAVEKVSVRYGRPSWLARLTGRAQDVVAGNRDITLSILPGEVLGIVGESGSGKSTFAKALTGLNAFTGEIHFAGRTLTGAADIDDAYRRDVQIVFQHPDASLNPRQKIAEILSRPLKLYRLAKRHELNDRVAELLQSVRLPASYAARYPHQLSGGEKQRVAIARAFASTPKLVICDEITSALDVSVQASVIELLLDLQRRFGTAYLFITHDLNLIRQVAHRIAVMYRGDLVELISAEDLKKGPNHPYTRSLVEAVPAPVGPSA